MTQPSLPQGDWQHLGLIDFARLVIDALEAAEADYMLGGALAVAAWAEARSTQDVDIVVSVPLERFNRLSEELAKRDMLVPVDVILDIFLETRADLPLNAIHVHAGYKAELFLLRPEDDLRAAAFARRQLIDLGPPLGLVYVHSPEDLILYKLHYFRLSQQPKHVRDIVSILLAMGNALDVVYLEDWARRLELTELWDEIKRQAQEKS
ncbi:MAG: hypothetical protein JW850_10990 [Thermoflexales bacterium]|nr:hypothetical protein [Thermoflexales bacterium]